MEKRELLDILQDDTTATEQALNAFAWGVRGQFFWEGNKRTSRLFLKFFQHFRLPGRFINECKKTAGNNGREGADFICTPLFPGLQFCRAWKAVFASACNGAVQAGGCKTAAAETLELKKG